MIHSILIFTLSGIPLYQKHFTSRHYHYNSSHHSMYSNSHSSHASSSTMENHSSHQPPAISMLQALITSMWRTAWNLRMNTHLTHMQFENMSVTMKVDTNFGLMCVLFHGDEGSQTYEFCYMLAGEILEDFIHTIIDKRKRHDLLVDERKKLEENNEIIASNELNTDKKIQSNVDDKKKSTTEGTLSKLNDNSFKTGWNGTSLEDIDVNIDNSDIELSTQTPTPTSNLILLAQNQIQSDLFPQNESQKDGEQNLENLKNDSNLSPSDSNDTTKPILSKIESDSSLINGKENNESRYSIESIQSIQSSVSNISNISNISQISNISSIIGTNTGATYASSSNSSNISNISNITQTISNITTQNAQSTQIIHNLQNRISNPSDNTSNSLQVGDTLKGESQSFLSQTQSQIQSQSQFLTQSQNEIQIQEESTKVERITIKNITNEEQNLVNERFFKVCNNMRDKLIRNSLRKQPGCIYAYLIDTREHENYIEESEGTSEESIFEDGSIESTQDSFIDGESFDITANLNILISQAKDVMHEYMDDAVQIQIKLSDEFVHHVAKISSCIYLVVKYQENRSKFLRKQIDETITILRLLYRMRH